MKKLLLLLALVICLTAYCGKLEDFADDFNDIVKNARVVERLDSNAKYRSDFKLKLFRLQAAAADIQMIATQIGIRDITIGSDVKTYISTINVDKKSDIKQETFETRSFAILDIRRQINYLKNLRFSVERRTFVPNKYYLDDLNVVLRFTHRWDSCKKVAFSQRAHSPYAINEYQKRYFNEILKLSRIIDQQITREGIKISDNYQLTHNVARFVSLWKISATHQLATRKRFKDNTHSGNFRTSAETTAGMDEMKLLASEIERDLNYLVESGFTMYLKDKRFSPEQLQEMRGRLSKDRKANQALPKPKDPDEEMEKPQPVKVNAWKVTRTYNEKKQQIYDSESKMNGVSQSFYNKYRALLPEKQRAEMDAVVKKYVADSYPPALARSSAVKIIHIKYKGNKHGCTPEELLKLMKLSPENFK